MLCARSDNRERVVQQASPLYLKTDRQEILILPYLHILLRKIARFGAVYCRASSPTFRATRLYDKIEVMRLAVVDAIIF